MKLQIPQSPEQYRVMVSITGPDITKVLMVGSGIAEVEPNLPEDIDERLLTVKAQYIDNARQPVGDEIVLQEPAEWTKEDFEVEYEEEDDDSLT